VILITFKSDTSNRSHFNPVLLSMQKEFHRAVRLAAGNLFNV
jgi:hypothetical protein